MRTVLSRICLFNDNLKNVRQHFIINGNGGEESKIAERERECVWEAAHGRKGEITSVIKWAVREIDLVRSMWD